MVPAVLQADTSKNDLLNSISSYTKPVVSYEKNLTLQP